MVEIEAVATERADGSWSIELPPMRVIVKRIIVGPDAPALGPVLTISSSALTVTLDRPATGPTEIAEYALERAVASVGTYSTVATGLNIFGSSGYPDTGLSSGTAYIYRVRARDTTQRYSEYSYSFGTTSAGEANQAPVWETGWSLSIQQNSSQAIASRASDPNGDPVSFSRNGGTAPASVTVSPSGVVDVPSSTTTGSYTLGLRASDGLLTSDTSVSLTVSAAASGTNWNVSAGTTSFNASQVQPGDTITLLRGSGTRGPLTIENAVGTSGNPITVRTDPAGAVTISGTSGFVMTVRDCQYVTIDGSTSGTTYGLNITCPSASSAPTTFLKFRGINKSVTVKNFAIDGKRTSFTSAVVPIGVSLHDNTVTRAANPGIWQEGHTLQDFYIRRVPGEGIYGGPNFSDGSLPMRNITIRDGLIEDTGRDAIQVKCWWEGTNEIYNIVATRPGRNTNDEAGQRFGISVLSGTATVHDVFITDAGESGIQAYVQSGPIQGTTYPGYGSYSVFDVEVYNAVVARSGVVDSGTVNTGHGITAGSSSVTNIVEPRLKAYNCTSVSNEGAGVNISSGAHSGSWAKNCIFLGNGSTNAVGTGGTNLTSGALATIFVAPGSDNYHLTAAGSAAAIGCTGTRGTDYSTADYDDVARSATAASAHKGAFEYV